MAGLPQKTVLSVAKFQSTTVVFGRGAREGGECYLLEAGKVHSKEALHILKREIPLAPSLFLGDKTDPRQYRCLILNLLPFPIL